jgi:mycothiol synthase
MTRKPAAGQPIEVVGAPSIAGLRFRGYRGRGDLPAMAEIANAAGLADDGDEITTPAGLRNLFANLADFVAERDLLLAEVDGRLVAFSQRIRTLRDGERVYDSYGYVHPEWRRRGLGRAMLRHNEAVARQRASGEHDPSPAHLGTWSLETAVGYVALLASEGYEIVRWFLEMERPSLDGLPEVPVPDGIVVRSPTAAEYRAVLLADGEAFQDHWGARPQTESDIRRILDDPNTDPTLWQVAWDGDDVAGSVLPTIYAEENRTLGMRRGVLDRVSVRRPWRRRGVARALMVAALRALRERGMTSAILGVDAESPTGALGLYEGLGFRAAKRDMAWRKPI